MTQCMDGIIAGDETCEDDDLDPADGCSSTCQIVSGWSCDSAVPISSCSFTCGDGI